VRVLGDEDLFNETTPQRCLDQVGTFGEEACGVTTSDGTLQLDRRSYPIGLLSEGCQAASPDGALTSSGSAALATSTRAVNAAGSLIAISDRFLRSTSTPASLRPWIRRL
jgi:hypothetical protein